SGSGSAIALVNTNAHVIIRNCTVTNAGGAANDAGISLQNVTNANVSGNVALLNARGIIAFQTKFTIVEKNNVSQSGLYGIHLWNSYNITISGNNASNNVQRGIFILTSTNITVSTNLATYNYYGIAFSGCSRLAVTANNASHNNIGIELDKCDNNSVSSNHALYNGRGIQLVESNHTRVEDNDALNNWGDSGIYLQASLMNNITGNNASFNENGIYLEFGSHENRIRENDASYNSENGLRVSSSNNNVFTSNNASFNTAYGAYVSSSNYNTFVSNTFMQNGNSWIHYDFNPVGNTGWDNLIPLGQVEGLSAVPGIRQVILDWTAPNGGWARVSHYNVYRSIGWSGSFYFIGINSSTHGFVDTGLSNGQLYQYMAVAVNALGEGEFCMEVMATTLDTPGQCSGLSAVAGDGQVRLTWTEPRGGEGELLDGGSPITNYYLYWSTDNVTFARIVLGVVTTYLHTGLTNGQVYYYKVAAVNAVGAGANSTVATATPAKGTTEQPAGVPGAEPWFLLLASGVAILAIAAGRRRKASQFKID
ncbi:MAG: right-handed parallel beta-helix repeat-containing protein, partial [Candidatus Sigynarchaeum springense]